MQPNKKQKIATIVYAFGILILFFAITPIQDDNGYLRFKPLFLNDGDHVEYRMFLTELLILTIFYFLALYFFKSGEADKS